LHACAHNPTGVDPTKEQWAFLADLFKRKQLIPFFDAAYQGFATGNTENDTLSIKIFIEKGLSMVCAQSYSKNFGLYGERMGCAHVLCQTNEAASNALSQVKKIARTMWSNPTLQGARIVSIVLNDNELRKEWLESVKQVGNRMLKMREMLRTQLEKIKCP